MRRNTRARAFSLIELLVVIVIIGLLVAILLPALAAARKNAREVKCRSNQNQYSRAMFQYANDCKERVATFSWQAQGTYRRVSDGTMVGPFGDDFAAATAQAVDIIRKKTSVAAFNITTPFCPYPNMSSLVLGPYLTDLVPEQVCACPEDAMLLQAAANPVGWFASNGTVLDATRDAPRFARSSYQFPYTFWSLDRDTNLGTVRLGPIGETVTWTGTVRMGRRKFSDVSYPSLKVMFYERYSRHTRKHYYFTHPMADGVATLADGSTRRLKTSNTNPGGYITASGSFIPATIQYNWRPGWGEPAWEETGISQTQPVHFASTLFGLRGVDFGGPEIRQ